MEFGSPFNTGYFQAMDREFAQHPVAEQAEHGHGHSCHDHSHGSGDVGMSAGDFGYSFALGPVPNIPSIAAKIRSGSLTTELAFIGGKSKGSGQGHTAGMYGKKQRQALKELSIANRMDWTTHTSVQVFGVAGQDRQGNFSREAKVQSIHEIKRALEFAADVGRGGPVVVHTGEFRRPVSEADWNQDGKWKNRFKMFKEEELRGGRQVVDRRTGQVLVEARKGRKVSKPIWKVAQKGDLYKDQETKEWKTLDYDPPADNPIYVNYFGEQVGFEKRVPQYNEDLGVFESKQMDWEQLENEAKIMTRRARKEWKKWKKGQLNSKEIKDSRWIERFKDAQDVDEIEVKPEEAYVIASFENTAANARGFAYNYGSGFKRAVKNVEKLRKVIKTYEELESKATTEEEKARLMVQRQSELSRLGIDDVEDPVKISELLKEQLLDASGRMEQAQQAAAGQWAQAEENLETIRHVESAKSYALRESYDAYAHAGVYAFDKSRELKKKNKNSLSWKEKKEKNLIVAMENLFPESYGAHPEELMRIVQGSRDKMVEMLVNERRMNRRAAEKAAQDHLKITFDVGHLNMWRKYWTSDDPRKSPEQLDAEFDQWMLDMTEELAKRKMIGHVHLDDNFGYQDEHLAPGEGNAPIKKMVEILKKNGYEGELIVEPGADFTTDTGGFNSVMKTWRLFGAPVRGTTNATGFSTRGGKSWSSIQYNHFGQGQAPYFTFGGYSPSEDWTLWSGVQLE